MANPFIGRIDERSLVVMPRYPARDNTCRAAWDLKRRLGQGAEGGILTFFILLLARLVLSLSLAYLWLIFGCRFFQHLVLPLHLLGKILGDISVLGRPLLLLCWNQIQEHSSIHSDHNLCFDNNLCLVTKSIPSQLGAKGSDCAYCLYAFCKINSVTQLQQGMNSLGSPLPLLWHPLSYPGRLLFVLCSSALAGNTLPLTNNPPWDDPCFDCLGRLHCPPSFLAVFDPCLLRPDGRGVDRLCFCLRFWPMDLPWMRSLIWSTVYNFLLIWVVPIVCWKNLMDAIVSSLIKMKVLTYRPDIRMRLNRAWSRSTRSRNDEDQLEQKKDWQTQIKIDPNQIRAASLASIVSGLHHISHLHLTCLQHILPTLYLPPL